jgi:phage terminase large subunit-like protein
MHEPVKLTFDPALYDEAALDETLEVFREVATITRRRYKGRVVVTITPEEGHDADVVAGELSNIVLARSLEVRSS